MASHEAHLQRSSNGKDGMLEVWLHSRTRHLSCLARVPKILTISSHMHIPFPDRIRMRDRGLRHVAIWHWLRASVTPSRGPQVVSVIVVVLSITGVIDILSAPDPGITADRRVSSIPYAYSYPSTDELFRVGLYEMKHCLRWDSIPVVIPVWLVGIWM
jgi:hypothetical protein